MSSGSGCPAGAPGQGNLTQSSYKPLTTAAGANITTHYPTQPQNHAIQSVEIVGTGCAGSPTYTPSATPSATPTTTPTESPVLTETPTFTISDTFTASPSFTPSPSSSPTPTANTTTTVFAGCGSATMD